VSFSNVSTRGAEEGIPLFCLIQCKLSSNAGAEAEGSSLLSLFIFHFLSIED